MKSVLMNKWHMHSLIILFVVSVCWYSDFNPEWFDFGNVGAIARGGILVFVSFCIGGFVEWIQGKFYGAHQGIEGTRASNMDVVATTVASLLGVILYAIFKSPEWIMTITILVVGALEYYRRAYMLKK